MLLKYKKYQLDSFKIFLLGNDVITDEDLVSVLQLGPLSRVFALAMLKLEYFTIKKSGVYSVHEKVIVYDVVNL